MQQRGQPFGADRDRDADHDLIEPLADAEQQHDERGAHAADTAGEKAEPERTRVVGREEARVGADQHHAFEADVEHPGLFRDLLAEARQQQRQAGRHRAEQQRDQEGLGEQGAHVPAVPDLRRD